MRSIYLQRRGKQVTYLRNHLTYYTHNSDPPTMLSLTDFGELSDVVENAEGIPAGVVVGHMWNPVSGSNNTTQPTNMIYGRAGIKRSGKAGNCCSCA